MSTSYEELFDGDEKPCYLPEKLLEDHFDFHRGVDEARKRGDEPGYGDIENGIERMRGISINDGDEILGLNNTKTNGEQAAYSNGTEVVDDPGGDGGEITSSLVLNQGIGEEEASASNSGVGSSSAGEIRNSVHLDESREDCQTRSIGSLDWVPGKRHPEEDDMHSSWRKHKKHFFILSNAGKPIYSRYGDEHKLAGFSATLQAIMSFVENSGDRIQFIRAGDHQILFLVKGPIYLVTISATDEPLQALKGQLELLHGQLLLILTKSVERCFEKNANFDMRSLLAGTETVFSSLIHAFSWNPAAFLHSYTCLHLPCAVRQAAGAALLDIADKNVLFALLISGFKVVSLIGAQKVSLHPDDIFLISNFVSSSESFRITESFSPVCLPHYNSMAFLYAYIHYLDTDTCLILLTMNADGFFHLKKCSSRVEAALRRSGVLHEIRSSVLQGGVKIENLPVDSALAGSILRRNDGNINQRTVKVGGAAGLLHFMYRSVYLNQYMASDYSPPLKSHSAQKRLFRAYQNMHASMQITTDGTHKMQYRRDESFVLLSWSTRDFELFAAFDPLAEKSSAIAVCNRVCQWLRDMQNDIFHLAAGDIAFSW